MTFLPTKLSYNVDWGSEGGPSTRVDVVRRPGGGENRFPRWSGSLRKFNGAFGIKKYSQLYELIELFEVAEGSAHTFLYKDWNDYSTASDGVSAPSATDVEIGVGDGVKTVFQMKKRYVRESGTYVKERTITKPIASTTLLSLDNVTQSSGWTVNEATGKVTLTTPPADTVSVKVGGNFDNEVRFASSVTLDGLMAQAKNFGHGSISPVPFEEVRDENPDQVDLFHYGGSTNHGNLAASYSLSVAQGRHQRFDITDAAVDLILPDATDLQAGGPYFFLENQGTAAGTVVANDLTTLVSIPTSTIIEIVLGKNASQVKSWISLD